MKRFKVLLLVSLTLSFCPVTLSFATEYFFYSHIPQTGNSYPYNAPPVWDGSSWSYPTTLSQTVQTSYVRAQPARIECTDGVWSNWSSIASASYTSDVQFQGTSTGTTAPILSNIQSLYPNGCPNVCSEKEGTSAGYSTETYKEGSSPSLLSQCLDGCYATAEKVQDLGPCLNGFCITSIKYTYTGTACTEPDSPDIDDNPPDSCYEQFLALANKCGGSGLINSFDWSTCTGSCDSLDCSEQWASLKDRCGDVTNIEFWNYRNCTGGCKSDPKPDVENSDAPPYDITTKTETHEDGSKTVTDTKTYNIDNTTYTDTTTTTYDSSGNQTGSSNTFTTSGGSDNGSDSDSDDSDDDGPDDESFDSITSSGFGESYGTGEFDIPGRFTTFMTNVKSSGLFSFSSDFFDSLPGGGSSTYEIDGGETFGGQHTIDLSETFAGGLVVVKTVLLAVFGFLSIRAIIMKR